MGFFSKSSKLYIHSLVNLFYPSCCCACGSLLNHQEKAICSKCIVLLPYTHFYKLKNNPLEKTLWGKVSFETIDSLLYFTKNSKTQELLHHLKYRGRQDIGILLAKTVYNNYKEISKELPYNAIITIPLHYLKQKKRGYNQCASFASTLSSLWNIPYYKDAIIRVHNNLSQTKKSRIERWENVENIFNILKPNEISNKHLLLIDDVITTGATIEACILALNYQENVRISILTIACTV